MAYIIKKINRCLQFIVAAAIIVVSVSLVVGIFYSSRIIYPAIKKSDDVFIKWEVKGDSPEAYGLNYQDIILKTKDGLHLKGWYIEAKMGYPNKAIVLVHGYGANKIKMLKYAPFLHAAGYDVLLFDLRFHGESEGRYCSFGYYEQDDIEAAVDFLCNTKNICKIAILGESLGGVIGVLAMKNDKRIKAGIFDSIFSDVKTELLYYGHKIYHLPSVLVNLAIFLAERRTKSGFGSIDISKTVRNLSPRAVFFIHGRYDYIVRAYNSEYLYKNACYPKFIWITNNYGHAQSFIKYEKEYKEKVLFFLKKWLH